MMKYNARENSECSAAKNRRNVERGEDLEREKDRNVPAFGLRKAELSLSHTLSFSLTDTEEAGEMRDERVTVKGRERERKDGKDSIFVGVIKSEMIASLFCYILYFSKAEAKKQEVFPTTLFVLSLFSFSCRPKLQMFP